MKRIFTAIVIIFIFLLFIAISVKPFILAVAKYQFKKIFIDSEVSIKGFSLNPLKQLTLRGVTIKKGKTYAFGLKELGIYYDIFSLFKGDIRKISLAGLTVNINMPQDKLANFARLLNLRPPGAFSISQIELLNTKATLKAGDIDLKASLSLNINLSKMNLKYIDLDCEYLNSNELRLEGAYLKIPAQYGDGRFYIQEIGFNKIKTGGIQSRALAKNDNLIFDSLQAPLSGGMITGNIFLSLSKLNYALNLRVLNLDIENIAKDLEAEDKFTMTGRLSGVLELKGSPKGIDLLSGSFSLPQPGGKLVISDKDILERLAKNAKQSFKIIVESFRDYSYNIGTIKLGLEDNDLVFALDLEGKEGKRKLDVILHNFQIRRRQK